MYTRTHTYTYTGLSINPPMASLQILHMMHRYTVATTATKGAEEVKQGALLNWLEVTHDT